MDGVGRTGRGGGSLEFPDVLEARGSQLGPESSGHRSE